MNIKLTVIEWIIIFLIIAVLFGGQSHKSPAPTAETKQTKPVAVEQTKRPNKSAEYGVMKGNTWWAPYENLEEFVDAVNRKDTGYLARLANTGRIFKVSRDTRVIYSDSGIYSGIIFVTFQEGQYTNQRGYTLSKCVR